MAATTARADVSCGFFPLGLDAVGLHVTVFAVDGFIDKILRQQTDYHSPLAILHFQKGLRMLRERLSGDDAESKTSDATIGAVQKLASAAHFDGDYEASKQHIEGIHQMIDLRGGLQAFKSSGLLLEVLRHVQIRSR